MGSRIRKKAERLFEVFVEIAKPDGKEDAPFIIQQYPPDYSDEEALKMIPRFAYPCQTDVSQVDHFTFVLTDLDSMFRFGYCRHTAGHQTCFCIVSWLPWCEVFYRMLDLLSEITNRAENNNVTTFLQAAYGQEVPLPTIPVAIVAGQDMFPFTTPDPDILPRIPGSRNLTEYYNAVETSNMVLIFASMLHERRIYMTSRKLSRLTACIHAAEALLYPMHWQHLYIPVLPAHLIDYISAPMPYLIGVHSNLVEKLKDNRVDVGDAVVVDLDADTVTTPYDDVGDLPEDVSSYLKRNLKTDVVKSSMMKTGDAVSKAFLSALVRLIGGYRDALKFRPGEPITFDPEAFVRSRPSQSTQAFLEGMLTLQIFQQFVYGRLEILNAGGGFADIFEKQALQFADKLNSQSKYKEWLKSVKKSGKKGWNGLKVKAAPMMSTAVHSVKEQGKRAMADIKTKLSVLTDNDDKRWASVNVSGGIVHTKSRLTAHDGTFPRAQRPATHSASHSEFERRNKSAVHAQSVEDSQDDLHLRLSYHTVDVSLMSDTDIQAAMLRSASAEILSARTEGSSSSSEGDSSSDSSNDTGICFSALHNSEGFNSEPFFEEKAPEARHRQGTADKLVLTRPLVSDQPVPAPRLKKAKRGLSRPAMQSGGSAQSGGQTQPVTVQDAPLIKFDSSESEPTDSENFDPLMSNVSPRQALSSVGEDLHDWVGNNDSFQKLQENDSTKKIFDPLSNLSGLSMSANANPGYMRNFHSIRSDPLSSHSPRRDSADLLMHEWSLASLAKGHGISLLKPAQPLKMSYPNNPFIMASTSNPLTCALPAGAHREVLNNQGHASTGAQQQQLYLGHKVSDFHRAQQLGLRQPIRAPIPTPGQLSAEKLAPYSHRHPSVMPRNPGVMNFVSPATPRTSSQPSSSGSTGLANVNVCNMETSSQPNYFTQLLNIDFGGKVDSQQQPETSTGLSTCPPSQANWETFD